MTNNYRLCFACNKANFLEDARCRECNTPLDSNMYSDHFLSDTFPADQQLDDMWNNAYSGFVRGDFCNASALLDEVLVINPQHRKARILKSELNDRYLKAQQIYDELKNRAERDLAESISMVKEAIETYPDHPSGRIIQTKLAISAENYSEAMQNGYKALQKDQWKESLEWFRLASQPHRAKPHLVTLIQKLSQVVDAKDRIDLALQQQDFDTAQYLARWVDLQVEEMKQQMRIFSDI